METQPALTFCLASGWEDLRAVKSGCYCCRPDKITFFSLWRRGESERAQGTASRFPEAGTTIGTPALSSPPPGQRWGNLKIFTKGGAPGEMDSGSMCPEHCAAPGAESWLLPHVLPFEYLWAGLSPSLASPVEWEEECSVHQTALRMAISVKCFVTCNVFCK